MCVISSWYKDVAGMRGLFGGCYRNQIRGFRPGQFLSFLTDAVVLISAEKASAAEGSAQESLSLGVGREVF